VGIYSDPRHVILYTSNGEARQEVSIVLTATPLGGEPTPSSESSEVRWVPEAELPDYTMDRSMRIRGRGRPSQPASQALSDTCASRYRAGGNPKDSDLTSDCGISFRQTQRHRLGLS
jgi:hypothetical protein